jgi:hypothetical protein
METASSSSSKRAFPHREKYAKVCPVCDHAFYVNYSGLNSRKTCSRKCLAVSMQRRVTKICPICERQFSRKPHKNNLTCSKRCASYFLRGGREQWKKDQQKKCPNCGKFYEAASGWRKEKMFCSRPCLQEHYRINGGPRAVPIGTRFLEEDGYWSVKVTMKSWRPEHIVIVEKALGEKLKPDEIVHHRNGDKGDNRIDNLQVMTRVEHAKIHAEAERIGLRVMAGELIVVESEVVHPLEGCEV